jgi:hypothetical protein
MVFLGLLARVLWCVSTLFVVRFCIVCGAGLRVLTSPSAVKQVSKEEVNNRSVPSSGLKSMVTSACT